MHFENEEEINIEEEDKKFTEDWETAGDELFYVKNKMDFSTKEKIIIKKLLIKSAPPLRYRRKLWLISSGALREMDNNINYYNSLLSYSKTIPCPSSSQIELDLKRTFPDEELCMNDNFITKLRNILTCYSIRNTSVGYCQGMNFIVGRLLLIMDNEEQVFWIFIQIMEKILPLNYYSELAGVIIDTTIIDTLISIYFPDFYKYLIDKNFKLSLSNFIHKWVVCLFSQSLEKHMIYTFFDFFFLEGEMSLFKLSFSLITSIQEKTMNLENDFETIYNNFNEMSLYINDFSLLMYFFDEKKFGFDISFINTYRKKLSKPIIHKLENDYILFNKSKVNKNRILKIKNMNCNPNWPICIYESSQKSIINNLVLKESKAPFIINDYYYIKNCEYQDNIFYNIDEFNRMSNNELLIERHNHICDDKILVDSSKNLIEINKITEEDLIDSEKTRNYHLEIYNDLDKSKDVDLIIKELKNELSLKENPIKLKDITPFLDKNLSDYYYSKKYSLYIIE